MNGQKRNESFAFGMKIRALYIHTRNDNGTNMHTTRTALEERIKEKKIYKFKLYYTKT